MEHKMKDNEIEESPPNKNKTRKLILTLLLGFFVIMHALSFVKLALWSIRL